MKIDHSYYILPLAFNYQIPPLLLTSHLCFLKLYDRNIILLFVQFVSGKVLHTFSGELPLRNEDCCLFQVNKIPR